MKQGCVFFSSSESFSDSLSDHPSLFKHSFSPRNLECNEFRMTVLMEMTFQCLLPFLACVEQNPVGDVRNLKPAQLRKRQDEINANQISQPAFN